ncbi:hypothetical protein AURDEDRAFT_173877 [Auricularia subglabra TFB-10046 SS5]|uniref:Protein kinase domain-containing protein n=1 Tax=Auricularia subglabra (strain TFB-10046 / SS5) TaxID=717982 RepID=J0WVK6_AURST|nr:hypothetical protein AURDEDRAFT_173877 [Auricularia subglabra TFB-10046 SS5]
MTGRIDYPGSSLPEVSEDESSESIIIPPKMEPEDIWAFGILVVHIYNRGLPFKMPQGAQVTASVLDSTLPSHPGRAATSRGLDFVVWRVARDCWHPLPSHRPRASQVLRIVQTHSNQVHMPETMLDLFSHVQDEVPDLTSEIRVQPTAPAFVGPASYARVRARWGPPEIAPRIVDVVLTRRDEAVPLDSTGWSRPLLDELVRWRRLRHANLVPLLGRCSIGGVGYAVSPAYTHCDARTWLADEDQNAKRRESSDSNAPLMKLLRDISNALAFLHEQTYPIRHGNVHIDNVFVPPYPSMGHRELTVNGCLGRFDRVLSFDVNDPKCRRAISEDVKMYGSLFYEVLRSRYQFPHDNSPEDFHGLRKRREGDVQLVHAIYRDTFERDSPIVEMPAIVGYINQLVMHALAGKA